MQQPSTPQDPRQRAMAFVREGAARHGIGDIQGALALYRRALELVPD